MRPGVTLVRYLAIGRYDNANASSTALTIDDEHASSGNSGRTLDGVSPRNRACLQGVAAGSSGYA